MITFLCHVGIVFLLYVLLLLRFGIDVNKVPPKDAGKIHHALWWGMFYGTCFGLSIILGSVVEFFVGWYWGHLATGTGFLASAIWARRIQKK